MQFTKVLTQLESFVSRCTALARCMRRRDDRRKSTRRRSFVCICDICTFALHVDTIRSALRLRHQITVHNMPGLVQMQCNVVQGGGRYGNHLGKFYAPHFSTSTTYHRFCISANAQLDSKETKKLALLVFGHVAFASGEHVVSSRV